MGAENIGGDNLDEQKSSFSIPLKVLAIVVPIIVAAIGIIPAIFHQPKTEQSSASTLPAPTSFTFSVVVRNGETGGGIPRASVQAFVDQRPSQTGITDDTGVFHLDLPNGTKSLSFNVHAGGFVDINRDVEVHRTGPEQFLLAPIRPASSSVTSPIGHHSNAIDSSVQPPVRQRLNPQQFAEVQQIRRAFERKVETEEHRTPTYAETLSFINSELKRRKENFAVLSTPPSTIPPTEQPSPTTGGLVFYGVDGSSAPVSVHDRFDMRDPSTPAILIMNSINPQVVNPQINYGGTNTQINNPASIPSTAPSSPKDSPPKPK